MKKLMTALCALASAAALAESAAPADDVVLDEAPQALEQVDTVRHWTPVELDLASPVLALPWKDRDVYGLKLDIGYGRAESVAGVDFGLVSRNLGETYGLQANVFNWDEGTVRGVQCGVLACVARKGFAGAQVAPVVCDGEASYGLAAALLTYTTGLSGLEAALLNWEAGALDGVQFGLANVGSAELCGLQFGLLNWSRRNMTGVQFGLVNCIEGTATGVQFGLVNGADDLQGVQLGLVNLDATAPMPLMVLANAKF